MKRCKKRGEWTEHQTTTTLNKSFLQNKVYTQEVHHKKGEEVGAYALPKTWVLHHYANFLTWHKHRRGMRLCSVPDLQLEGLGTRGRRGGRRSLKQVPAVVKFIQFLFCFPYLEGVIQPVDWGRVEGADHLQHSVEIVQLLEDQHDLDDARQHCHTFLNVLRLQDALLQPESELKQSHFHFT